MSGQPFRRGLVVGKFSPLHRGHELVIRRALELCLDVVVISYSKPEFPGCEAVRREQWLAKLFPGTTRLVITDEWLATKTAVNSDWRTMPANDADESTHRRFCGFLCQEILGVTVDAVFTSEDYGAPFAAELTRYFREHGVPQTVTSVLVDPSRSIVPVSGTLLRADLHAHRRWLAPEVYASFVRRVCLLGGESSGKSTLAAALADEFQTLRADEFGRELWEARQGKLVLDDMLVIARRQVEREESLLGISNRFLFCDTSPLTTLFYSEHLFRTAACELRTLAGRSYDFTVVCAPDFKFVQDGTRQAEQFRARQHEWYLRELAARKIPQLCVRGRVEERVAAVRGHIG